MAPISVPQRKKCSPVLREPLVDLLWDLFLFGTEQERRDVEKDTQNMMCAQI